MSDRVSDTAVFVDSGIDYITASCGKQKANDFLTDYCMRLMQEERESGNEVSTWFMAGYSGISCGSVQAGKNGGSRVYRLSGVAAQRHWQVVAGAAENVSRLDAQCTLRLSEAQHQLPERCERQAKRFAAKHNQNRAVRLIRDSVKGKTLYVGSRHSDRFMRVYDKGAESKLESHGRLWRAEVEFKRSLALRNTAALLEVDAADGRILSLVLGELCRVGIVDLGFGAGLSLRSSSVRVRTDVDKKLSWLSTQVAPTVQFILQTRPLSEVLAVLGISDLGQSEVIETDGNLQH